MNKRELIIAYAKKAIGCSYDSVPSGGAEGKSYNCSFLTFCAYRAAGLIIPTWQGHQNGDGSQSDWVRWAGQWSYRYQDLKPGDLCFYGSSPYNTYHVGIYAGDGWQIDSIPNGGVQRRRIYETFCGGGWPFKADQERKEVYMGSLLVIDNKTLVYFDGCSLHDVSVPEDISPLDKVANACTGKPLPRCELSGEEFARVCQVLHAGEPMHLHDLLTKYPPR